MAIASKTKYSEFNLTKEVQDQYTEKYKPLLGTFKKTKVNGESSTFKDWKTPYCKDDSSVQIDHRFHTISMKTPATTFRNDELTLKFVWKGKIPGIDKMVL